MSYSRKDQIPAEAYSLTNKYISLKPIDECPRCGSQRLVVEGWDTNDQLSATTRDLLCFECGYQMLEAISRVDTIYD